MSDLLVDDDVVTIDGKNYSRLMAEEMARDIELAHSLNPQSWSIGRSSALQVGGIAFLRFAEPNQHAYIVDSTAASPEVQDLITQYGGPAGKKTQPTLAMINIPEDRRRGILELARPAHHAAVTKLAKGEDRCDRWRWHSFHHVEVLERVVGRDLPHPAYLEELRELRRSESSDESSGVTTPLSDLDPLLLAHIAEDIETAHRVNPRSWAFYTVASGGVILVVEAMSVSYVAKNRGGILVAGDLENPDFRSVDRSQVRQGYKYFPGFSISANSVVRLRALMEEFKTQRHQGIIHLAGLVKTRTQRANEHQPDMLDALSTAVGRVLPRPDYEQATKVRAPRLQSNSPSLTKRYWKISPGPAGKHWPEFRDRSVVAVYFSDELADLSAYPDDQQAFTTQVKTGLALSNQAANTLWDFVRVIQSGDGVLAYANGAVVGSGTVTGDYELVDDDFAYMHRRPVSWTHTDAQPTFMLSPQLRAKLRAQATLFELTPEQFAEATGQLPPSEPVIDPRSLIRNQFSATGLHYTDEQIATFYTALQTKGFGVLSGISGTGKSKIATGFVEMLPDPSVTTEAVQDTDGMMSITVKPYMPTYKRIILPSRHVDLLPPLDIGKQTEIQVSVDGVHGNGRIEHRAHTGGSSINVLYFRSEVAKAFASLDVGTRLFLRPTLSDDGDAIERVELLRRDEVVSHDSLPSEIPSSKNHLFLSVRPDWRDSTSLLGYYNPLTQTYEWTEFLRFLLRAQKSHEAGDGYAWFVIFDEMNLAHVEYYFADLLSVIESGRDNEGWTREPLRLTYPDTVDDEVPPHELRLPPNLYIIGTVNMDETTHAFSPKVLDRAFTIELADVNLSAYATAIDGSESSALSASEKAALLAEFTRGDRFAVVDKKEIREVIARHPRILADLEALNGLLQQNRMHFGYRVFDEICQYLFNNDENEMMRFEEAFDRAVFMKVLPKFSGSRARLQSPLFGVLTWAVDPQRTSKANVSTATALFNAFYTGTAAEAWTGEPIFPTVAGRVRDMLVALERDGFVSFG